MIRFLALFFVVISLVVAARRAPGFSIPDSNLEQHDLQDYRGKLVILEIMQTNCPHCAHFTDVLNEAAAKYGTRVAVLSLVVPPDTNTTVHQYISAHKVIFPVLFDCGQVAASYLQITPKNPTIQVPHVYIISPDGMILSDHGYAEGTAKLFEAPEFLAEIDKYLGPAKHAK